MLEQARGQGIGSALWTAGAAHLKGLGVTTTRSLSIDGVAAGARFLERRGFRVAGRETSLELDLGDVPPAAPIPVGIHLVRVPSGSALFRDVYELEVETVRDIPGEEGVVMPPFEAWLEELAAEGEAVVLGARPPLAPVTEFAASPACAASLRRYLPTSSLRSDYWRSRHSICRCCSSCRLRWMPVSSSSPHDGRRRPFYTSHSPPPDRCSAAR